MSFAAPERGEAVIVDDERLYRDLVHAEVLRVFPDLGIKEAGSLDEAIAAISEATGLLVTDRALTHQGAEGLQILEHGRIQTVPYRALFAGFTTKEEAIAVAAQGNIALYKNPLGRSPAEIVPPLGRWLEQLREHGNSMHPLSTVDECHKAKHWGSAVVIYFYNPCAGIPGAQGDYSAQFAEVQRNLPHVLFAKVDTKAVSDANPRAFKPFMEDNFLDQKHPGLSIWVAGQSAGTIPESEFPNAEIMIRARITNIAERRRGTGLDPS